MHNFSFLLIALTALGGSTNSALLADGGQVRFSERHGAYQVTVFTSPTPLRAGPVDVSVFVQNAESGEPVHELAVDIELTPQNGGQAPLSTTATTAAATNKLFQAAEFELGSPGEWNVRVECRPPQSNAPVVARFSMEAGPPLPAWLTLWPWFGWPVLVIGLYVCHRILVAQRTGRSRRMQDPQHASLHSR